MLPEHGRGRIRRQHTGSKNPGTWPYTVLLCKHTRTYLVSVPSAHQPPERLCLYPKDTATAQPSGQPRTCEPFLWVFGAGQSSTSWEWIWFLGAAKNQSHVWWTRWVPDNKVLDDKQWMVVKQCNQLPQATWECFDRNRGGVPGVLQAIVLHQKEYTRIVWTFLISLSISISQFQTRPLLTMLKETFYLILYLSSV